MKNKKIAVIGMGYVGIPAAVLLADAGYDVTGIQRRSKRSGWKIDWLNDGRCPIGGDEPEMPALLKKVVKESRFSIWNKEEIEMAPVTIEWCAGKSTESK